jgi:hypothetical protein
MKTTFCLATVIVVLAVLTPLAHAADVTRAWDNKINGPTRWMVLTEFNSLAVFDKETGLVWARSALLDAYNWDNAHLRCNSLTLGNRMGWRLPTIQELASLVDPSVQKTPSLPSGYPFTYVPTNVGYWAATTYTGPDATCSAAWGVDLRYDPELSHVTYDCKDTLGSVLCVRGGQGVDPQ